MIQYYSSGSNGTKRFAEALGIAAQPLQDACEPFILFCPTYSDGFGNGAVPVEVIRYLNKPSNRALMRGVVGFGNRNFGSTFCLGARMVATKCEVPLLYKVELSGNSIDMEQVRKIHDEYCGVL